MNLAIGVILKAVDKVTGTVTGITASVTRAQTVINQHQGVIKRSMADLKKFGHEAAQAIKTVAVVAGMAGGALFALAKSTADYGDSVNDTSGYLGISTKALQEYYYIGKLTGVKMEDMNKALSKLTVNLGKADDSKGLQQTFAELGLSLAEIKSAGPDRSLDVIANAVAKITDPTKRAAIAVELFGKSGIKMVNVLAQGGDGLDALREEANKTGFVMSSEAIQSAAAFDDSMQRMTATMEGMRNRLGGAILPKMTVAMEKFSVFIQQNGDKIAAAFGQILGIVESLLPVLMGAVNIISAGFNSGVIPAILLGVGVFMALSKAVAIYNAVMGIVQVVQLAAAASGSVFNAVMAMNPVGLVIAAIAALIAIGFLLVKNWDSISKFFIGIFTNIRDFFVNLWTGITSFFAGVWEKWGNYIALAITVFMPFLGIPLLIIKNWSKIVEFLAAVWGNITAVFDSAVKGILSILPDWLVDFFTGGDKKEIKVSTGENVPTGSKNANGMYNKTTTEKTQVSVRFENPPAGTQLKTGKMSNNLDLSMGYGNVAY